MKIINLHEFPENPYSGELLPNERKHLFQWLIEKNPSIVFEIGTGSGGGSSFYILNALKQLDNNGHLYTFDPYNSKINNLYQNTPYNYLFTYYRFRALDKMPQLLSQNIVPDFIFYDGAEDATLSLMEFQLLEQYVKCGCIFVMHDWIIGERIDGNISEKSTLVRPYVEKSNKWDILNCLESQDESVGLVRIIRNDRV